MLPVNEGLVFQRLAEIREARDLLGPVVDRTEAEFVADRDAVDAAKYRLLVGIEACAQICTHLIARLGGAVPESFTGCFQALADAGVIAPELAGRLTRMARFRNLVAHRYCQVDDRLVHEAIVTGLRDWEEYVVQVEAFLQGVPRDADAGDTC